MMCMSTLRDGLRVLVVDDLEIEGFRAAIFFEPGTETTFLRRDLAVCISESALHSFACNLMANPLGTGDNTMTCEEILAEREKAIVGITDVLENYSVEYVETLTEELWKYLSNQPKQSWRQKPLRLVGFGPR